MTQQKPSIDEDILSNARDIRKASTEQIAYDARRSRWIAAQGIRVLRISNQQVLREMDRVLLRILEVCEERIGALP